MSSRHPGSSRLQALAVRSALAPALARARQALARARSLPEVKRIRDQAEALRAYVARQRFGLEVQQDAAELKLRAERRAGEILARTDLHPGGRPNRSHDGNGFLRLGDLGIDRHDSSRWQRLAAIPEERFEGFLADTRGAKEEITTAAALEIARGAAWARVALARPESVEWYTPAVYVDAAREVLGGIDLDPASSEEANRTVRAARFYTSAEDGLAQPWAGRVWMNPPYSALGPQFVEKLLREHREGRVSAAVLLLSAHATEAGWFQGLWDHVLLFTNHRIAFLRPGGAPAAGSFFGNVFCYLGPEPLRFAEVFGRFGAVVRRWPSGEGERR